MFDVIFYTHFKKKYNSTLQPSGGTSVNCHIITQSDAKNPTLEVRGYNLAFNYAYIPAYGSYYYIRGKTYDPERALWVVECEKDVLATYRGEIGTSIYFITRCENGSLQPYLEDTQLPPLFESTTNIAVSLSDIGFTTNFSGGTVCVQTIGQGTILLSGYAWNELNRQLCSPGNNPFTHFTEWIGEDFLKAIADPVKYLKSAVWLPVSYGVQSFSPVISVPSPLQFGYYSIPLGALRPESNNVVITASVPFSEHPQAEILGEYLNRAPYTKVSCYVPILGNLSIPSNIRYNALNVRFSIDILTGSVSAEIYTNAGQTLASGGGNVGCPLLIGQITQPVLGVINGAANAVMGAVSGNPMQIGAGAMGIGQSLLGGNDVKSTGVGSGVSALGLRQYIQFSFTYTTVHDRENAHIGKPYFHSNSPTGCGGGYMQVRDGYVTNFQGDSAERKEIAEILERGFYYE